MIVVLARIKTQAGSEARFEALASALVQASRQEPGMAGYTLLKQGDGLYCFLEQYRDEDAVEAHRKTEHFRSIGREMGACMDGKPTVERFQVLA